MLKEEWDWVDQEAGSIRPPSLQQRERPSINTALCSERSPDAHGSGAADSTMSGCSSGIPALGAPSAATVTDTATVDGELLGAMETSVRACVGEHASLTSAGLSGQALPKASRPATSNCSVCGPPAAGSQQLQPVSLIVSENIKSYWKCIWELCRGLSEQRLGG